MKTRWMLVLGIGLAAEFTAAQTYTVPDEGGAEHKCMYRLRLEGGGSIEGVAFSNDGESLYLRTDGQAINVWEVLVYYWPELLGGLSAMIAVPCILLLWRVRRRPRIVGELHCRHCNYCVRGVESGICPECGRPIRRSIVGRPVWRRTAIPLTLLTVVVLGYGSLWALRVVRTGPAIYWLNWWSYELKDAAQKHGYALNTWVRPVVRIVDVDARSGQTRRTLITRPNMTSLPFRPHSVPGEDALLTRLDPGDVLALVDTRTGAIRRTLAAASSTAAARFKQQEVLGYDERQHAAYVVRSGPERDGAQLVRWNLRTGAVAELLRMGMNIDRDSDATFVSLPQLSWIPGSEPPQFLELHETRDAGRDLATLVRIHEIGDAHRILSESRVPSPVFILPGEDGLCYYCERGGFSFFRLRDGQPAGRMEWEERFLDTILGDDTSSRFISTVSRRLFPDQPFFAHDGFLVGDLKTRQWIDHLPQPSDMGYTPSCLSPDGRYFAAVGRSSGFAPPIELIVYDLSWLPSQSAEP